MLCFNCLTPLFTNPTALHAVTSFSTVFIQRASSVIVGGTYTIIISPNYIPLSSTKTSTQDKLHVVNTGCIKKMYTFKIQINRNQLYRVSPKKTKTIEISLNASALC